MVQYGKGGGQYETRSAQTQSKKKDSSQDQLETPARPSRGIKNASWLGVLRNPKKFAYNKVYKRTTFDVFAWLKKLFR